MTNPGCPSVEEFSRRITLGEAGPLAEHFASCHACGAEWDDAQRLRALVRELPTPSLEASAVSAVRERVLEGALEMERTRRRRRVLGSALAVAAMVAVAALAPWRGRVGTGGAPQYHAVLTGGPSATFVRESGLPNEVVRLDEGTLHVEVEKLRAGERFVVHAGDGEVEVRGTAFDVTVLDGHLSSVHVERGRVEVRAASSSPAVLSIGEEWKAAPPRATPTPLPEIAPTPSPAPAALSPEVVEPSSEAVHPRARGPAGTDVGQSKPPEPTSQVVAEPTPVPEVVSPMPAPAATAPPPRTLPGPAKATPLSPVVPVAPPTSPAASPSPVPSDPHGRDDARRERRDERHERYDQRRLR
jgi:hypothetical protein